MLGIGAGTGYVLTMDPVFSYCFGTHNHEYSCFLAVR